VRVPTLLLQKISDLSAAFEAHARRDLTVNATDLAAMHHLIRSGPLTPTDLASRLSISTAAATTVIDRLTALGHANRIPNPADRRGVLVVPTEDSVARVLGSVLPMVGSIDATLDEFTVQEQAVITEYLERVVEAYVRHVPGYEPAEY
jgi:DNA-binding MarR family transcriptional regulator